MADVGVRAAQPQDAQPLARVQLVTWRTAYGSFLPADALNVPEEQAAALWLRAIELPPTPGHRVLVATEGATLVGFAASGPAEDEDAVELSTLLVEPRWGRRGHGSRLLAATVAHWREGGATRAVHWAWERDAVTRSFLTGAGWELDGTARALDTGARLERQVRLHTDVRP